MTFSREKSIEILERTPIVLHTMLQHISADWTLQNEGGETWSVYDIIGHLIHGEKTDWVPRVKCILSENQNKSFKTFDRYAQFNDSKGKSLEQLLDEFKVLRTINIEYIYSINITEKELQQKGLHPTFGEVALSQLLATWVVHDLNHIAQICRVMAKQYKDAVGSWVEYLSILQI